MAITLFDPSRVGSTPYWLTKLSKVLDSRAKSGRPRAGEAAAPIRPTMKVYREYYEGEHRLLFATAKFREVFGDLFAGYNENICGVVVDTLVERMTVLGIRLGDAQRNDERAWAIWQENDLDSLMARGFREAATCGEANLLIGPNADNAERPLITVEDSLESVVVSQGRRRLVGLKRWYDAELDRWRAFVYYPDRIEKLWGPSRNQYDDNWAGGYGTWGWEQPESVLRHDLGVVPLIPLAHRPNLTGAGMSELAEVVPIQDAINKTVVDMLVASEFGAFRQRWATGMDIPIDPDTGERMEAFTAAVNRLWIANPPEGDGADGQVIEPRFGEFGQTDLGGYINAVKQRLQMACTIKRMPPHYLLGEPGQLPSGESLTAAETGLVAKAINTTRDYDSPIEEAFRVAFLIAGDGDSAGQPKQVVWRDARFRTESEHVDALVKLRSLGIPDEVLWEQVPFTAQDIRRIKRIRLEAAREMAASFDPMAEPAVLTEEQMGQRVEWMGRLINAGFTAESAADVLGIAGLEHTGHLPVTVQPTAVA